MLRYPQANFAIVFAFLAFEEDEEAIPSSTGIATRVACQSSYAKLIAVHDGAGHLTRVFISIEDLYSEVVKVPASAARTS